MSLAEWMDVLANITMILGFPIALLVFIYDRRKERREREYGTYHALDEKYLEYLRMCIDNPHLNLYDVPLKKPPRLSETEKTRQSAMFDILVSLLERAFLMYQDQSNKVKRAQWIGWNEYMRDYASHPVFRETWKTRGIDFEVDFTKYINQLILDQNKKQPAEDHI